MLDILGSASTVGNMSEDEEKKRDDVLKKMLNTPPQKKDVGKSVETQKGKKNNSRTKK